MEMMKKYIVYGGKVRSRHDKQIHYVSAGTLANLYRVNPKECIMIDYSTPEYWHKGYSEEFLRSLKVLKPKNNGDYTL